MPYLLCSRCLAPLALLALVALPLGAGCSDDDDDHGGYEVPLDPGSPWPKFRRTARQDGRSPVRPTLSGGRLWSYQTGKGIFSSPVVGADGTIYIGSADRYFYAIRPDGTLRWRVLTGEIIDSSALLDDRGRVYVGSGDGHLYALDQATGEVIWTFEADPPEVTGGFIRWFEGNVAMGPDGTLYAPNDNFYVYAIDRDTGAMKWRYKMLDQTWSLPAVDPASGALYVGNNNLLSLMGLSENTYAIGSDGQGLWTATSLGSVAASPLLTREGLVVVGSFDGILRAYDQTTGAERWAFPTRDHLYASPGQLSDGTIIQPSADGSVYALSPVDGSLRWAFDALEPLRSSPAIDGEDHIYLGSGEGRLFVLNPDGTLRWAMRLIGDDRNDLNASPALGRDAVILAGESGEVFSVPYDYCLRPEGGPDPRCLVGPGEDLPEAGASLLYTTRFGAPLAQPPGAIRANQALAFSLFVREAGDTRLAVIDSGSVEVTLDPTALVEVSVSGERRFLTVTPLEGFRGDEGGQLSLTISGDTLVDLEREGLRFYGGTRGASFAETFVFDVEETLSATLPLPIPAAPGDEAGIFELSRLAAPLPTILPSYNQIGFDSLHYLVGLVEPSPWGAIGFVVGGRLAEGENRTTIDPASKALFPVEITWQDGLITLVNAEGFTLEVMNATIPMDLFRVSARLDESGLATRGAEVLATTLCAELPFYGSFLEALGFCNPDLPGHPLTAFGAVELGPHGAGVHSAPEALGLVSFIAASDGVTATLTGSGLLAEEHHAALLLVDASSGRPVTLDYGLETLRTADGDGLLTSVRIPFAPGSVPGLLRVYLLVDAYPAARTTLSLP